MRELKKFKNYLENQGLRLTRERRMVVEEVANCSEHFTASDLLDRVQKRNPNMGRSTVYRIIPLLLRARLITKAAIPAGREEQLYEVASEEQKHDHLTCDICGEVVEFKDEQIEKLHEEIAKRYGYKLRRHFLNLHGVCPNCQEKIISGEIRWQ